MANAMTEHSKKLRAKTAAEWNKRQREAGLVVKVGFVLPKETADQLAEIAEKLGVSRTKAISIMCGKFSKEL
ncbi:hypothetical protein ACLSY0_01900 [Avibacterium avium]|uniref:hypothetical protein n=1 Tax=Avibacterium avium TaxID=751 RepID=UPI003BF7A633